MEFNFAVEMQKLSNEELIKILTTDKEDYLPEAIKAASDEFNIRNLQPVIIDNITRELLVKKNEKDRKANEPLDFILKITTFFFPFLVTFLFSGYYKANGYDLKANQLAKWTLLGFCFYFVISIIFFYWN